MTTFAPKLASISAIVRKYTVCIGFSCLVFVAGVFASCGGRSEQKVVTPWGEVTDSVPTDDSFDLSQLQANGELIMLTVSGPDTYYDYRGRQLGTQYMLCQKFAERVGVSLRVELCRDTTELVRRLLAGEGDIAVCQLDRSSLHVGGDSARLVRFCGASTDSVGRRWAVSGDKPQLACALDEWYSPKLLADVRREEAFLLSAKSVTRHVYAPMLNRKGGVISRYDALFATYSRSIRWDWKLMAAQCYQESTFDPQAKSWAGACGLMQIMPATAEQLGLPMSQIHDPESNIAAASKLLAQLEGKFSDVPNRQERVKFVLGSYNGGFFHIRDAMALTAKHGGDPHRWADVSKYVVLLSNPQYYRDPVVKYGYMRGSETADYVQKIQQRWASYRGVKTLRIGVSGMSPQKAKHKRKKKYDVQP